MPRRPKRQALFEEVISVDFALPAINLDSLRRMFSGLFDRAALTVQRAGFDQDDAVVERFLICRAADYDHEVSAESLSDPDRLATHVFRALTAGGVAEPAARRARIIGLKAVAIIETLP